MATKPKKAPVVLSEEIRNLLAVLQGGIKGFQYDTTDTLVNLYAPVGDVTVAFAAIRRAKFYQPTGLKLLLRRYDATDTAVKLTPSQRRVTRQGTWATAPETSVLCAHTRAFQMLKEHLADLNRRAKQLQAEGKSVVDGRSFKPGRRNRAMPTPKA